MKLVTLNLEEKDMKTTTTTTMLMIYTSLENMKDPESIQRRKFKKPKKIGFLDQSVYTICITKKQSGW
jgi:hypothetical protein